MHIFHMRYRTWGLYLLTACWTSVGLSYLTQVDTVSVVFGTKVVGVFFCMAAVFVFLFALKPYSFKRFFRAGVTSEMAIFVRASLIIYGQWDIHNENWVQTSITQICLSGLLFGLFWWAWQTEVKAWHAYELEKHEWTGG